MFYNPKRKHARNGMLSPVDFEQQQKMKTEGVQKTQGYSMTGILKPGVSDVPSTPDRASSISRLS
jgi:hypothetical protein